MSEAATLGILRDLLALSGVALVIAVALYAVLRRHGGHQWSYDGNVLSRPYGWPDALMAMVLVSLFTVIAGAEVPAHEAGEDAAPLTMVMVLAGMLQMPMIALVLLVHLKIRRLEPSEMFGIRQMPVARCILWALLGIVISYVAMVVFNWLFIRGVFNGTPPDGPDQEPVQAFRNAGGMGVRILMIFAVAVVAPIAEEIIFRGFLYGVAKRYTDRWFAAVVTSVLFACVHRHFGSMVPLFVLALGLSVAYESTGCLLVPMFMHAMFNSFEVLVISFAPQS